MLARAFGERLHRYREDRGLSQRQLAIEAGLDAIQISRYERGLGLPAADSLAAIAKALKISLDTLLLGQADRMSEELPVKNVLLLTRLREVEKLSRKDQQMIMELIDSVIARRRAESPVMPARRTA